MRGKSLGLVSCSWIHLYIRSAISRVELGNLTRVKGISRGLRGVLFSQSQELSPVISLNDVSSKESSVYLQEVKGDGKSNYQ